MPIQGIDVSYWQGDIDWDRCARRVSASPSSRRPKAATISIRNSSTTGMRPRAPASRAAPIISSIGAGPRNEQALWFMLNVPADSDALPPVLDLEWNSHSKTCPGKCRRELAIAEDQDHARRHGGAYRQTADHLYRPQIPPRGARRRVPRLSFLAALGRRRTGRRLSRGRDWSFWQFTTTGSVPGVAGRVDRNSFNGTRADWDRVLKWLQAGR